MCAWQTSGETCAMVRVGVLHEKRSLSVGPSSLSPPPPLGALQSTAARPLLKWREQAARNSCRRLWALPPARLLLLLHTRDAKLFAREPEAAERASSLSISAGQFSPLARRRPTEAASPLALLLHQVAGRILTAVEKLAIWGQEQQSGERRDMRKFRLTLLRVAVLFSLRGSLAWLAFFLPFRSI